MEKRNFVYLSESGNGYENLAADEWFLDHVREGDLVLHLYQNENAVIIGKNQNPWLECDLDAMEKDGVQLVRRVSGGGAVYHDAGNLNFSFITGKERYDVEKQLALILSAVKSFGIDCTFSGRNDLIAGDKKFSGNAFAHRKGISQHHGTLLLNADLERLGRYLKPDEKKIRSKGIASVRARVENLSAMNEAIDVKGMKKAILSSFEREYGYFADWQFSQTEREEIASYEKKHSSAEWRLGQTPKFDQEFSERYSFGTVRLLLSFEKGKIASLRAYSDAMEPALCEELERVLSGVEYTESALREALTKSSFSECREMAEGKLFL